MQSKIALDKLLPVVSQQDVAALHQMYGSPWNMLESWGFDWKFVEHMLINSNKTYQAAILAWMQPAAVELALSPRGTHIVQKALDFAGTADPFIRSFHGRVRQCNYSHHGNHVLQKIIAVMPPHALHFILDELSSSPGGWPAVIKHRFGCRVVQRLLEHLESQYELIEPIVSVVVNDLEALARHPYANYVVQQLVELGQHNRNLYRSGVVPIVDTFIQVGVHLLAQDPIA